MNSIHRMAKFAMFALLAIATAFTPATASAQSRTFAQFPGITGGSVAKGHEGWIDIMAISQGWSAGKKSVCQLALTKQLDVAGPQLWLAAVTGQTFPQVRIDVVKTTTDASFTYYTVVLQNATISSISTAGATGGDFMENLMLNAASVTLSYYPQRSDGSLGSPVTTTMPCN